MTQHEVASAILAQIPPVKRPAHISDRELAETYLELLRGIEAEKAGESSITLTWDELNRDMGIEK